MQLELALADLPAATHALWDRLDPALKEALLRRLALVIAKAIAPASVEEVDDE